MWIASSLHMDGWCGAPGVQATLKKGESISTNADTAVAIGDTGFGRVSLKTICFSEP
jgi:hypothetical protein